MSPQIGFYHLLTTSLEEALPKLLVKILGAGHRALVMAGSAERVASSIRICGPTRPIPGCRTAARGTATPTASRCSSPTATKTPTAPMSFC